MADGSKAGTSLREGMQQTQWLEKNVIFKK
jgi:hypothetical protein